MYVNSRTRFKQGILPITVNEDMIVKLTKGQKLPGHMHV